MRDTARLKLLSKPSIPSCRNHEMRTVQCNTKGEVIDDPSIQAYLTVHQQAVIRNGITQSTGIHKQTRIFELEGFTSQLEDSENDIENAM